MVRRVAITRIIHKHPDQRLYDSALGRYIHLVDIRALVAERSEFIVVDKVSGQDVTRETLLLLLTSLQPGAGSILTKSFLLDLILIHGTPLRAGIANVLDGSAEPVPGGAARTGQSSKHN
jgi:polyhydroxyalkanoate synthesis repressor PhaR